MMKKKKKKEKDSFNKKKVFFCFQPLEPPGGWKCYSRLA
jgi:hypothetical protein